MDHAPLRPVVRRAQERLDAAGATVAIAEDAGLRVVAAAGTLEPLAGRLYSLESSIAGRAIRTGASVVVNDVADVLRNTACVFELAGTTRVLAVPVPAVPGRGAALLVGAGDDRRPFDAADIETAQRLAAQATDVVHNAILARELREREEALRRLSADLRAAVRAKHRFFAWSSHELRTPLNAALCYNDLLSMGVLGSLTERQQGAVDRMGAAIRRLCRLVEGLFELGELEGGDAALAVAPVDVRAVAEQVVTELAPTAVEHGVYLRMATPADATGPHLETDADKVRRVLLLLCTSAITFTERGGVTIRVHHRGGDARIDVVDTGCDIARRDDWLGEGGARPAPDHEQSGLGPAIAHQLAALLGGRIVVRRRIEGGATASLRLPPRAPAF